MTDLPFHHKQEPGEIRLNDIGIHFLSIKGGHMKKAWFGLSCVPVTTFQLQGQIWVAEVIQLSNIGQEPGQDR